MSSTGSKGGRGAESSDLKLDTASLRREAQARFRIRNLEKELQAQRPSKDTLESLAEAVGPGNSLIVHDETGAPFALANVRAGRSTLDTTSLLEALTSLSGDTIERTRSRHSRPGNPYWEFKEATL